MTLNEYAIKLGLSLNSAQIQFLDLIEERKDESLIITFPRLSGRQLMYNLVQRKKGYDEGYEQGKADAIEEFVKKMKKYWGGLRAMDEIERVAEQLKEQK